MKQFQKSIRNRTLNQIICWLLIAMMGAPSSVLAQRPPASPTMPRSRNAASRAPSRGTDSSVPPSVGGRSQKSRRLSRGGSGDKTVSLNFKDSPLEMVLNFYSQNLDDEKRTMIIPPSVNANITLKSQSPLTREEASIALEAMLAMHNITLVPMGEKFYKVVQIAQARQDGMPINMLLPEESLPDTDELISQMIELNYITIAEVQPVIQQFLHGYGKIQPLERINSLLVTDTSQNIQRVLEVLEFIDRPVVSRVETRVYEVKYAEAGKIAAKLNEIIADVQEGKAEAKPTVAQPSTTRQRSPAGVIRARRTAAPTPTQAAIGATGGDAEGQKDIIHGKVKIIADDRTNILLVISDPSNFTFFDKIVTVLDRPVEAEITVRIESLEYADAEEIAGILNDFIGAASSDKKTTTPEGSASGANEGDAKSKALQQYVKNQASQRTPELSSDEKAKIGQLSPNTKILADKRTNSLLLMGRRSDIAALKEVIDQLDIMLAQVLIEVVILEIGLNDKLEYGVDWLQRAVTVYDTDTRGANGGVKVREPVYSFAGGTRVDGGADFQDASQLNGRNIPLGGALSYYATFFDLNLDMIVKLAASDRNARILQTPVILTTDNTDAKIVVGEERPIVTSTTTSSDTGNQTSHYEYKDIGIEIAVTPRINPERFVVMDIKQTANNVQGTEKIDGNDVPIITKREMEAQVAVKSRSTIALGGLIQTDRSRSKSKVPILGDIPLLGALFRSESREDYRTELLVLITPYVLMTPEEARDETARLKNATKAGETPWPRDWSDSPLATPGPEELKERKKEEKEKMRRESETRKAQDRQRRMEERRKRREQLMADPFVYEPLANEAIPVDDLLEMEESRVKTVVPPISESVQTEEEVEPIIDSEVDLNPVVLTSRDAEGNPMPLEGLQDSVVPEPKNVPVDHSQEAETLTAIEVSPSVRPRMLPEEEPRNKNEEQLDQILKDLSPDL